MVLAILSALMLATTSAFAGSSNYCQDLEIGKTFTINESEATSKTQLRQIYTLKRESENEYVAYLNLKYVPTGELKGDLKVVDDFEKKVDDCFTKTAKQLTDEMGVNIRLERYKKETDAQIPRPEEVRINLHKEYARENANNYKLGASCDVIVHESLHLMGLVDEYTEHTRLALVPNPNPILRIFKSYVESPKGEIAYDCRATGVVNSVMSKQDIAFLLDDNVLYSAQTSAIIYPNCESKNKIYYDCGRLAYLTSKEHGSVTGCGEVPSICRTPYWLLKENSPLWESADYEYLNSTVSDFNLYDKKHSQSSDSTKTSHQVTKQ